MKYYVFLLGMFLSSCGNLIVTPRSCNSDGYYGEEVDDYFKKSNQSIFVWMSDKEIKIKDLVDCKKVDTMKVLITKKMFVKYNIEIRYKEKL